VKLASSRIAPESSELAVLERTPESFALERLVCLAIGAMIPLVTGLLMTWSGVGIPLALALAGVPLAGLAGAYLPVITIRRSATIARRNFRSSLSAYLDLVSIMLAGGAGAETALVAAARVGSGRTFSVISDCLDIARSTRRSAWSVLADEGERLGIVELPELASTIQLSGEQGARMTASLVAKARAMRTRQMAEIEASANSATERMGLPMVSMFMGFLVLLGYPAMHLIGQGFSS
jgi:Flp pilus assembly protein TadB